ncbi:hypothetical protein FAUST_885, partial [Fusarium austroamericanum]
MTSTPNKRPQHALYEGMEPGLLCFNPMLPFLARLLAYRAFRDYQTIDDLLTIMPPEGEMWMIQWQDHLLETPFFRGQSRQDIETAGAFSHRLRALGLRAGYPTPPRHHDIRAEGLRLMNQFESEATRMVYAGHTDPNTLLTHYLPQNGADGQAAYHGQGRRTIVLDLFRGLTIPRNPSLRQCLPAKEQYDCDNSADIMRISREIVSLRRTADEKSMKDRKKLYAEKRKLVAERLRNWQKNQPVKHDDPPGYRINGGVPTVVFVVPHCEECETRTVTGSVPAVTAIPPASAGGHTTIVICEGSSGPTPVGPPAVPAVQTPGSVPGPKAPAPNSPESNNTPVPGSKSSGPGSNSPGSNTPESKVSGSRILRTVACDTMVAKEAQKELEEQLKNDDRDVADLWKEALKSYQSIVGFGLQPKFNNVQSMLDFGTDQMNNFHKFRHDKGKVDRLRSLFSDNLDLIQQGANQVIAAAAPAFPPAAAIGTALTYILQACRSVSADYDIIIVFFEDMNSFLGRISILETRLPKHKAYQNCLMEVFTSLLTMCGFAHKYIELGRFKKWISNLFKGDDGELSGARKKMNKNLDHLQQATEFAILGNTEETLAMTSQLDENQRSHAEMLERVGHTIDTIHENTENIRGDIEKILKLFGAQKKENVMEKPQANKPPSSNSIRNSMPIVFNDEHEYQALKETLLPDSCSWVFSEPEWEDWLKMPEGTRPILALTADPGTGKSHLAAALYDKLAQRAAEDETGNTCVAHFYFREQDDSYGIFLGGIITVINRIAETNHAACEKLNAQIAKDEVKIEPYVWQSLVQHLLVDVFGPDSKFNLFIVFDGLDELRDWPSFKSFLSDFFNDKGLRISLVVTSRPERLDDVPENTKMMRIEATKKRQVQDLRALIWNEMNSLSNLRRFNRYVQQRIADTVEEASPNMLYAQHMLARLNDMGREGAILRALGQDKPRNLHDIYEIHIAECQRRMPSKYKEVAASLLHWVAFAKRLVTLTEVQSLVKYLADDDKFDIEEIHELFDKFLRVGGPGYDTEVLARIQTSKATAVQDLKHDEDDNHDGIYDDGPLPVTFKERSMRHYFTNSNHGASTFRWGPSEANRRMLITSAELLRLPRENGRESLLKYCALCFITHLCNIQIDQHTAQEQIEVLEAFAEAMSDKTGMTEILGKTGVKYGSLGGISGTNENVALWAQLLDKAEVKEKLSEFAAAWWHPLGQKPATCRLDMAKGYLRHLHQAQNEKEAFDSWENLLGVLKAAESLKLLMDQAVINFPELFEGEDDNSKEIEPFDETAASLGILNLFGDEIKADAAAHRAISQVLHQYELVDPAEKTCRRALELCNPSDDEWYRTSSVLSSMLLQQKKKKEAYQVANAAVEALFTHKVPPSLKRITYTTYARSQRKLGHSDSALESFAKAKTSDPDGITPGQDLVDELKVVEKRKSKSEYIQMIKQWSLLERITWVSSEYVSEGEDRHAFFCDIASETGEQDFIVRFYEEVIAFMDNLDAGTPFRLDLALVYMEVCQQPEKALTILDQVFDSRATAINFPLLGVNALFAMLGGIVSMTNVQMELFRKSRDPKYKAERLASLEGLMQRPLPLDVPQTLASWRSSPRVGLAYMYLVMGPLDKFQETVQSLLDDCWAGLSDSVGWNDSLFVLLLAQILALMSKALRGDEKLRRYARIVGSAVFSDLDGSDQGEEDSAKDAPAETEKVEESSEEPKSKEQTKRQDDVETSDTSDTSDDEEDMGTPPTDEGDLVDAAHAYQSCGGFCNPAREFFWWGGRSAYLYTTYASGMICEECQAEYDAVER